MFSWFLKLLGIEEDRPVSSNNAFSATSSPASTPAAESTSEPEAETETTKETPQASENKPAEPVVKQETPADTSPEQEPEPASSGSLEEAYPKLKANFVKVLTEAGFTDKAAIDKATDKELLALKGIGQATLKILRGK